MRICWTYSDLCSCNFIDDKLNSIKAIAKVYVILDHPSYIAQGRDRQPLGSNVFINSISQSIKSFAAYSGVAYVTKKKTLPWPLFVIQGFYIPKCLTACVGSKNGSCHFFF